MPEGLLLNAATVPAAPGTDKCNLMYDSADEVPTWVDDQGSVRKLAQNALASIVAASGAINTTETIIVGGLNIARIKANQLKVGTVIRITLEGTCTSTAGNVSTFRIRFGTAGTTGDGAVFTAATAAAQTSGTTIPFEITLVMTIRTIGASGTIAGYMKLINQGTTGISTTPTQMVAATAAAIATNVDSWIEATYVSAATTTTCTFQNAMIEIVKI